jgi:aspartyl-tRNA(Asn)/glutamyl-tRNA(Gln) amidotransferase subunit B
MLYDGARGEVRPARAKEGSHDYRYFPEPDLAPLVLAPAWIEAVRSELPELPAAKRERIRKEYELGPEELRFVTAGPRTAEYFETVARAHGDPKTAANWMMTSVQSALKTSGEDISGFALRVRPLDLARLLDMVRAGTVSTTAARSIFTSMAATGDAPERIAEAHGLTQVNDDAELEGWITAVLAEHPAEAERYLKGDRKLQGVFVGHVMKKSKGRADPKRLNQLLAARTSG